eukprot:TRINITY_DN18515_c0_g1_i1.p1 TRINITY_DN18515_c0_g1~~TRINITY_DN18515_c0_g1_i1.p1  ORF type:complete len:205 (-),score=38.64 TRINITY_DN18515_c0_g1_i1:143-721(-)
MPRLNDKDNVQDPTRTKPVKQQLTLKEKALHSLFTNNAWSKDTALEVPKQLPTETIPTMLLKINTHRGNHFVVVEEKEEPLLKGNCLWIGSKISRLQIKTGAKKIYSTVLEKMVQKIESKLRDLNAVRVNASILMKDPQDSPEVLIIFVCTFSSEGNSQTEPKRSISPCKRQVLMENSSMTSFSEYEVNNLT